MESRWGRHFPHLSRPALGPTQPPVRWVAGLSRGVKSGRCVALTTHLLLAPRPWKGNSYTSTPVGATTGPATGLLYLFLPYSVVFCSVRWLVDKENVLFGRHGSHRVSKTQHCTASIWVYKKFSRWVPVWWRYFV